MISFLNDSSSSPFLTIRKLYAQALEHKQDSINAICVSSYNASTNEVNSRLVNLKFVDNESFIFFTNYNSPKAIEFQSHNQVATVIFWSSINIQIRMRGTIAKTSKQYNEKYFYNRNKNKNALAISSNQSAVISTYDDVVSKYEAVKMKGNLLKCPNYWGGYSFMPNEIELWEGNESRLNKRNLYKKDNTSWSHFILEP